MASSSSSLSQEQLLCSLCQRMLVEPVSTPCGHNFCMSCLSSFWDRNLLCFCPVCQQRFSVRPQLRVNTFISGLFQSLSSLQQNASASVLCDVCTAPQRDAHMSCVECLSSFCSDHLEPHHRVPGLRRHTLVPPKTRPQDRVCPQHQQPLHSYCPAEGALLCVSCEGAHSRHRTLPLEQACSELRAQLGSNEAKVSSLIQERVQSVCSIRDCKAQRHEETRRVITQSEEVVQDVLRKVQTKVQKSHKDLVLKLEEKQQQADSEAEALVVQTEDEIKDLTETLTKLQELEQIQDTLLFLQKHPPLSLISQSTLSSLRPINGLGEIKKTVERCTTQLQEFLKNLNDEISLYSDEDSSALTHVQEYAISLKLDPSTAHPDLYVSQDLKKVQFKQGVPTGLNNNTNEPKRFYSEFAVLADQGFSSGQFYFEVFVGMKQEWILGLVEESVPRHAEIPKYPGNGLWALYFRVHSFYDVCHSHVPVHQGKVERVGVFVDRDRGLLSFYDVKTATCIYSLDSCEFNGKIYPYFNPCNDELPLNSEPMIIVPVARH